MAAINLSAGGSSGNPTTVFLIEERGGYHRDRFEPSEPGAAP